MDAGSTPLWHRRLARTGTAAAAIALALLAIPGEGGGRPASATALTPFRDCTELTTWFAAAAAREGTETYGIAPESVDPRLGGGGPLTGAPGRSGGLAADTGVAGGPVPASAAASGLSAGAEGPGATGTNLAEAGVDEPALLKVAGERVVSIWENRLQVTDVSGTPRELGSLTLQRGSATELILVGDRALVLGTTWTSSPLILRPGGPGLEPVLPDVTTTVLTVVDLSASNRPTVVRTEEIDGSYLSAREHDGVVRVVLQSRPAVPLAARSGPWGGDAAGTRRWLPQRTERDGSGAVVTTSPALDCTEISHPTEPTGTGLLTVLTLDLAEPQAPITDRAAVATSGDVVYASTDRLVVATQAGWQTGGQTRTEVHGFDLTGRTSTRYVGSGEVPGWILGRWALSSHNGFLRVASTRDAEMAGTDSVVTVLAEVGVGYRTVGTVGGLGRGEQVRAVRWFGDIAVVVTFRQTDPLYTLDLADPAAPRVLGELKVPGYSGYLHPLGDGMLLGVGQAGTGEGDLLGTAVSTFDLRDLAKPALLDTAVTAQSWSDVESDARQFSYLPGPRVAVLPVGGSEGSALWSLHVDADGMLTTAGRWTPEPQTWLAHAVPVGDDRLAVLSQGESGSRLSVLSLAKLAPLGSVPLA